MRRVRYLCPEPSADPLFLHTILLRMPGVKGSAIYEYDEDLIITDKQLSLAEGAIELWERPGYTGGKPADQRSKKEAGIDVSKPYN